jgi:hypothetical protein
MEPLIVPTARGRYAALFVINLVLLIASLWLLAWPQVRETPTGLLGGVVTLFMAVSAPLLLWQVFDRRPFLIVDEWGIFYRPFGLDVIPWSAIADIHLKSVTGTTLIDLELDRPEEWLAQSSMMHRSLAWLNRLMGYPDFSLNFSRIAARPEVVFERMQQFHSALRLPSANR